MNENNSKNLKINIIYKIKVYNNKINKIISFINN